MPTPKLDPSQWLDSLMRTDIFDVLGDNVLHNLTEFVCMITDADKDQECGMGKLRCKTLKKLVDIRWLDTSFFSWMAEAINLVSQTSYCFVYADMVFEGKLRESVLCKIKEKGATKLISFLNVGRSTYSDDPLYKDETYLSVFIDNGEYRYAKHFSLLYVNFETFEAFYGDSLGWCQPLSLVSDIDNWSEQLLGTRGVINNITECHDSSLNEEGTNVHTCLNGFCSKYYPLQSCENVCGPVTLVVGAIAALKEDLFPCITNSVGERRSDISFLKNPTLYNNALRVVLAKWYITDSVIIDDVMLLNTSKPSKRKGKRKIQSNIQSYIDTTSKRSKGELSNTKSMKSMPDMQPQKMDTCISDDEVMIIKCVTKNNKSRVAKEGNVQQSLGIQIVASPTSQQQQQQQAEGSRHTPVQNNNNDNNKAITTRW